MPQKRVLGTLLKRHRNFNEYWLCSTCKRPRRKKTPREEPCKRCGCRNPPLKGITRHRGDRGAHNDSRNSAELMKIATGVRRGLRLGTNEFPPGSPTRELLESVYESREVGKSELWFTQVFIEGLTYAGHLKEEVCLTRTIIEVRDIMSDKKMMQIRIPPELHKWFKLYATKNETTMTEVLISYLYSLKRREEQSVNVEQF